MRRGRLSSSMSGTSSSPPLPRGGRPRRLLVWAASVALLAVAALAAAALIPGSHSGGQDGPARPSVAADGSPSDPLHARADHVYGTSIAATKYGTAAADRENGVDTSGHLTSDLTPLAPRRFRGPVAGYRAYAERWAGTLGHDVTPLTAALRHGDRGAAREDWSTAFSDYLHLGAVYGLLPGALGRRLAGLPPVIGSHHFVGLHRIEMGLWTDQSVRSLAPLSARLAATVTRLRHTLPSVRIDPLAYATRAHEILEDAQRDLMTGSQVPWSGAGVLGTAAGVAVTRKVIATLAPLLSGRDNTLGTTRYWLVRLSAVLAGVRRRDGTYPALRGLSATQRQRIDATLAGALGALANVPGTLETTAIPEIPTLPASRR